jgi:hypothetical protein
MLNRGQFGRPGMFGARWVALPELGCFAALCGLCIASSLVARLVVGHGQPLWLDEAWTGAIVTQPNFAQVIHQIYLDVNAPLYFIVLLGWTKIAGISDFALRFPSFLFSAAVPLLVLWARPKELRIRENWVWACLLALWFPGLWYAQNARCYALLLLLATMQALLFIRLIALPRLGTATAWSACSAALILTHYDAVVITACQGLIYVGVHRRHAVRTWPAVLAFAPTLAWGLYHLPRLVEFSRPDVAWYALLGVGTLPKILVFVVGLPVIAVLGFAAVAAVLAYNGSPARPQTESTETADPLPLKATAGAAGAAFLVCIVVGFIRPSFDVRYLVPVIPGVMLGLVAALRLPARRWPLLHWALVLIYSGTCVGATAKLASQFRVLNFEESSSLFEKKRVNDLAFTLDSPESAIIKPEQYIAIASFFFHRDGYPIHIRPVFLHPGDDASRKLTAAASGPHGAILWIYDRRVHDTVARTSPPRIEKIAPAWRCRSYGAGPIGSVACWNTAGEADDPRIRGSLGPAAANGSTAPLIRIRRVPSLTPGSDSSGFPG